jgi:hypothetical protein
MKSPGDFHNANLMQGTRNVRFSHKSLGIPLALAKESHQRLEKLGQAVALFHTRLFLRYSETSSQVQGDTKTTQISRLQTVAYPKKD